MNWRLKACVQNAIALLPKSLSYRTYYAIQKASGSFREVDTGALTAAVTLWQKIQSAGREPRDKVFFEVGTGRVPATAIALYLMGARRIITVDLHRYIRPELTKEFVSHLVTHESDVFGWFGDLLDRQRWSTLLGHAAFGDRDLNRFFADCCIDYRAPFDAAKTALPDRSVDFHVSFTVLEHIPPGVLCGIFREANRIISPGGLFVHCIDYSDHFSHSDRSISPINFLQYSDEWWRLYGANSFMYMNRLRHDDFLRLYRTFSHGIIDTQVQSSSQIEQFLGSGDFRLAPRFAGKSADTLSITSSWIVSEHSLLGRPEHPAPPYKRR